MEITQGKYLTKFSEKNDSWDTYYKNHLIASTPRHLWESEDMDFGSRQAGEALLYTTIELTAGMSEVINREKPSGADDIEDSETGMPKQDESKLEKTDDGSVKDTETPSDKIQYKDDADKDDLDIEDQPDMMNPADPEEQQMISMIQDLIEQMFDAQHNGGDVAGLGLQVDAAVKSYADLQRIKLEAKLYNLLNNANQDLSSNVDCTATLDEAEKIITALKNM